MPKLTGWVRCVLSSITDWIDFFCIHFTVDLSEETGRLSTQRKRRRESVPWNKVRERFPWPNANPNLCPDIWWLAWTHRSSSEQSRRWQSIGADQWSKQNRSIDEIPFRRSLSSDEILCVKDLHSVQRCECTVPPLWTRPRSETCGDTRDSNWDITATGQRFESNWSISKRKPRQTSDNRTYRRCAEHRGKTPTTMSSIVFRSSSVVLGLDPWPSLLSTTWEAIRKPRVSGEFESRRRRWTWRERWWRRSSLGKTSSRARCRIRRSAWRKKSDRNSLEKGCPVRSSCSIDIDEDTSGFDVRRRREIDRPTNDEASRTDYVDIVEPIVADHWGRSHHAYDWCRLSRRWISSWRLSEVMNDDWRVNRSEHPYSDHRTDWDCWPSVMSAAHRREMCCCFVFDAYVFGSSCDVFARYSIRAAYPHWFDRHPDRHCLTQARALVIHHRRMNAMNLNCRHWNHRSYCRCQLDLPRLRRETKAHQCD